MTPPEGRHHLLIDADDTLWENNIYFEDAFEQFVDFLDHSSMSAAEIRDVLDEIEIANIKIHGYGAANFARNLAQCYERLAEREIRERRSANGDVLCRAHSRLPHAIDRGRQRDARLPGRAPRADAVHQGPPGRAEAQDRPLRVWACFSATPRL